MPETLSPDADGLVGSVTIWPSDILPGAKYRFCEGEAISRTEFSLCFARLGTKHGVGDGSTTFTLPNYIGMFLVGYNSADADFDTIGETGGVKDVALSTAQMPAHSHTGAVSASTGLVQNGSFYQVPLAGSTSTGTTGSGDSHENLPPYRVTRYIIKVA